MSRRPSLRDRYRGALVGLAAGDALGTTLEFRPPGTFTPMHDIVGGGPFDLLPGEWTDDTSMALCLAESLIECRGHDPTDQLRRYVRWFRDGHLSSNGRCFDIGTTVRAALSRFERTGDPHSGPTHATSAGNGSLMRLAPVPLAFAASPADAVRLAGESSRTTHGATEAVDACRYFAGLIVGALTGVAKEDLFGPRWSPVVRLWEREPLAPKVDAIALGSFRRKSPPEIRGSGYVVDALEAALWAIEGASTFREACTRAVNLGDDADTTGAIAGQLAGALWGVGGEAGIPDEWVSLLALRGVIEGFADGLLVLAGQAGGGAVAGESPDVVPAALGGRAFWVVPGRLMAGAYPGAPDPELHAAKLKGLRDAGISHVISLMEAEEVGHGGVPFRPYATELGAMGVTVERYAIRDVSTPSEPTVVTILDAIDGALDDGRNVYVHCWGGRGRTGTIIGCWLVRHGLVGPEAAVARLTELRVDCADARVPVPDTDEQARRVRNWSPGR